MPKVPQTTGKKAKKAFERAGFVEDRMNGSHCILKKPGHKYVLSIPMHDGKNLGFGLLRSLIQDSGLTIDRFNELLK